MPGFEEGLAAAEAKLDKARRRFNDQKLNPYFVTFQNFEDTDNFKRLNGAVLNAQTKLNKARNQIADTKKEKARVRQFNEFRVQNAKDVFKLENDLKKAIDAGNVSLANSIREKAEIKRLTSDILRLEDLRYTDNGIELSADQQIGEAKRRAKILFDEFQQAKRQGEALAKRNAQLDEARRLFEESRTPIERYNAELKKLNAIKLDPKRLEIIGGKEGLERQLAQDLIELASRTKDNSLAQAELDKQVNQNNISTERAITLTKELADVSGRTAEINQARAFKQSAATPLEALNDELGAINKYEADIVADTEKYAAYGGQPTGERLRVQAISGFLSESGGAEAAIAKLVEEFEAGRVGVENFGAAFKELTENSEEFRLAGDALTKLGELRDVGVINSDAYNAAANAIKQAKDYTEDLTEAEKRYIEKLQEKVALEIQELEIKKAVAQAAGEFDEVAILDKQIDKLREKNNLIGLGIPEQEAETLAADIAKNEEIAAFQGQVKNAMSGAFRAAMSGNFDDFLRNKLQNAAANMFDRALDSLLDTLFSALENINFGGGEGGGLGGLASLFAGFFADGGTIQRGQFGIVGEAGPELAYAGSAPVSIVPFKPSRLGGRITGELDGGARVSNSSVVMNIQTPDVQSFRKARAVIEGDMAVAQRRAQRDI